MQTQSGGTCGVVAAAVALSILWGYEVPWGELYPIWPTSYLTGVTPGDLVNGINKTYDFLGIHATINTGKRDDLLKYIQMKGVVILVVIALPVATLKAGVLVGHWLVLIGITSDGQLYFMNPANGDTLDEKSVVQGYGKDWGGCTDFNDLWSHSNPWVPAYTFVVVANSGSISTGSWGNGQGGTTSGGGGGGSTAPRSQIM